VCDELTRSLLGQLLVDTLTLREFLNVQAQGEDASIVGATCETFTSLRQWLNGERAKEF